MTALPIKSLKELEREESILEFLMFKEMDYGKRVNLTFALAAGGVLVQVAFLNAYAGLPLLLAAVLLSWVVGFDNNVDRGGYRSGASWEAARFEQMAEILALDRRMKKWDDSAFDLTCVTGFVFGILTLLGVALTTFALSQWSDQVALIFAIDAVLLLLFQWLNGMRTVHRQPSLLLKVKHLVATARPLQGEIEGGGKLGAQLLMRGGSEKSDGVPAGAKLAVTWPDGPAHFYGLQGQVVVNNVQGTKYPYFYTVLVARSGHGLIEATEDMNLPHKVIRTKEQKDGVDVVVIRQYASKTGGYHTDVRKSQQILRAALQAAARYVAQS